jgi:beta-lactamase regulating signal transducer with metallopeptidase domain
MSAAAFFVELLVRSTLWLAMVGLAAAAVRRGRGSAAMVHQIWLLGMLGLAMLPLLVSLMPPLALPILPEPAVAAPTAEPAALATAPSVAAAPAEAAFGLGEIIAAAYFLVVALLLGRLALGRLLLARLWFQSCPADSDGWTRLVAMLAAGYGIRRRIALRFAPGPAMPMTWGSARPRILLPDTARGWCDGQRRIVLLHELAHVSRLDSFSRAAAQLVCALYWFHPGAWYAARRLRIEQEHACDDLVLAQGAGARDYAYGLLEAARSFDALPILARMSVAMVATAELERRLIGIVRRRPRGRAGARFTLGFGVAALVGTAVAASVTPVATVPVRPLPPSPAALPSPPDPSTLAAVPPAPPSLPLPPSGPASPPPLPPAAVVHLAVPAPPVAPIAPVIAAEPASPPALPAPISRPAPSEADYDAAFSAYRRELRDYDSALRRYNRELAAYNRQVATLAAQGNLANSGNSGNSGHSGNSGQPAMPSHDGRPGRPAILPTLPTLPTAPTPPTPRQPPPLGP